MRPEGELFVTVLVDGVPTRVSSGDSAAAAVLRAGHVATRTSPATGELRGPYCHMGTCFECLMTIDGQPSVQACLVRVREGMSIARQVSRQERA